MHGRGTWWWWWCLVIVRHEPHQRVLLNILWMPASHPTSYPFPSPTPLFTHHPPSSATFHDPHPSPFTTSETYHGSFCSPQPPPPFPHNNTKTRSNTPIHLPPAPSFPPFQRMYTLRDVGLSVACPPYWVVCTPSCSFISVCKALTIYLLLSDIISPHPL